MLKINKCTVVFKKSTKQVIHSSARVCDEEPKIKTTTGKAMDMSHACGNLATLEEELLGGHHLSKERYTSLYSVMYCSFGNSVLSTFMPIKLL